LTAAPHLLLTVSHQQCVHRHSCCLDQHLAQLAQLAGKVQRCPAVIVVQVGVGALQESTAAAAVSAAVIVVQFGVSALPNKQQQQQWWGQKSEQPSVLC
jgi:negative regulator of sigma E activity